MKAVNAEQSRNKSFEFGVGLNELLFCDCGVEVSNVQREQCPWNCGVLIIKSTKNQQSVGSTGNGVPLSGLTVFVPQFELQGSRLCWENMCLPVRAETSSLGCGTGLKVPPTVGALPRIPRD
ncbi:hypothetical protein CICLE_v10029596mg [Citrus x clementina]|uniref:Uncharacterized protein n=1 Tax=Citrus clementina TaxID=85681 RepID=V4SAZ6_CITCL|nr:hypothetical protein CICLE_v10029596mg [Citrus x clementina]